MTLAADGPSGLPALGSAVQITVAASLSFAADTGSVRGAPWPVPVVGFPTPVAR